MDDDREFPPIDPEQVRSLLAVAYQGIQTALDLNTQLAVHVDRAADEKAHRLNDAVFMTLNDVKQRLEAVIGRAE
jgi:hypothetical protein